MRPTTATGRTVGLVATFALFGLLASGCSFDIVIGQETVDGSGEVEVREFDLDGFDEIEIGSSFDAQVTVESGVIHSVEIKADDNFFDYMDVEVDGDTLKIGSKPDTEFGDREALSVTVVLPDLSAVDVSGATDVAVDASDSAVRSIDASGASDLKVINVDAGDMTIDASGASTVEVSGSSGEVTLDASGASDVLLTELDASSANVDLSGGSSADFDAPGSVTGDLSGASTLTVTDGASVEVDTSGASSVERS